MAAIIDADRRLNQVILEYLNPAATSAPLAASIGAYPGSCHCCASVNLVNRLKRSKASSHHQLVHHHHYYHHHQQQQQQQQHYPVCEGGQEDLINSSLEAEKNLQAALKRLRLGAAVEAETEAEAAGKQEEQNSRKTLAALPPMPLSGVRRQQQADEPEADRHGQQQPHRYTYAQNPRLRLPELVTDRLRQRLEFPEAQTKRYAPYQARLKRFQDTDTWH